MAGSGAQRKHVFGTAIGSPRLSYWETLRLLQKYSGSEANVICSSTVI